MQAGGNPLSVADLESVMPLRLSVTMGHFLCSEAGRFGMRRAGRRMVETSNEIDLAVIADIRVDAGMPASVAQPIAQAFGR